VSKTDLKTKKEKTKRVILEIAVTPDRSGLLLEMSETEYLF